MVPRRILNNHYNKTSDGENDGRPPPSSRRGECDNHPKLRHRNEFQEEERKEECESEDDCWQENDESEEGDIGDDDVRIYARTLPKYWKRIQGREKGRFVEPITYTSGNDEFGVNITEDELEKLKYVNGDI